LQGKGKYFLNKFVCKCEYNIYIAQKKTMAKLKKDGTPKKSGGKRPKRIMEGDRKTSINLSVKKKIIDSPEKIYKLKMFLYQRVTEFEENNS
jgi:hypothetical protein